MYTYVYLPAFSDGITPYVEAYIRMFVASVDLLGEFTVFPDNRSTYFSG